MNKLSSSHSSNSLSAWLPLAWKRARLNTFYLPVTYHKINEASTFEDFKKVTHVFLRGRSQLEVWGSHSRHLVRWSSWIDLGAQLSTNKRRIAFTASVRKRQCK